MWPVFMHKVCVTVLHRLLTGIKITDLETAQQAMHQLHKMGAKTVVISSSDLGSEDILVGLGSSVASEYELW